MVKRQRKELKGKRRLTGAVFSPIAQSYRFSFSKERKGRILLCTTTKKTKIISKSVEDAHDVGHDHVYVVWKKCEGWPV